MKSPLHIVWRNEAWMILYANGRTSRIRSRFRDGVIGIALSLGRVVVVHRKDGSIEYTLQPEEKSRFHATMFAVALSFLALCVGAVCLVIWLARLVF